MYIRLDFALAAALVAMFAGCLVAVLLIERVRPAGRPVWLTPSRRAGVTRALKMVAYPAVGVAVSNGALWAAQFLTSFGYDPQFAGAVGLMVGASLGGVAKANSWAQAPVTDPSAPPTS